MSDVLTGAREGDLIDCYPIFVSKRPTKVEEQRVTLVTFDLAGNHCTFVVGPDQQSLIRSWRVGDRRHLRCVLVYRLDGRHSVDIECPACGTRIQSRSVLERDLFADSVRRAANELVEPPVLTAMSNTTVEEDCPIESTWRESKDADAVLTDGVSLDCPQCGRTVAPF